MGSEKGRLVMLNATAGSWGESKNRHRVAGGMDKWGVLEVIVTTSLTSRDLTQPESDDI